MAITLPITARDLVAAPLTNAEIDALLAVAHPFGTDTVAVAFALGLQAYIANRHTLARDLAHAAGKPEGIDVDQNGAAVTFNAGD